MSDPDRLTPEVIAKFDEAIALRDRILREEAIRETEQKVEALLAKEREAKEAAVIAEQAALREIEREREAKEREREAKEREREAKEREREAKEREREAKEAALKELAELKAKLGLPLLRSDYCDNNTLQSF